MAMNITSLGNSEEVSLSSVWKTAKRRLEMKAWVLSSSLEHMLIRKGLDI